MKRRCRLEVIVIFFMRFSKSAGQGGGNFFEVRDMTELERSERIRKEARHQNHHNDVCDRCPRKYRMKNANKSNKVVRQRNDISVNIE